MIRRSSIAPTLLVAGALALVAAGGTLASWAVVDSSAPSSIAFGSLNLHNDEALSPEPLWFDASTAAPVPIDPSSFLASAGDRLRMGDYFTLDAAGNNLVYTLNVAWDTPPDLGSGVTATFTLIENPSDPARSSVIAEDQPLGTPVTLPAGSAGTRSFLIHLLLTYAGDRPDRLNAPDVGTVDIGRIRISAEQTPKGAEG